MPLRRPHYLILLVLIVIVITGLWWLLPPKDEAGEKSTYDLGTVKRGNIIATVSATGTLNPVTTVQVGSQVSGTIQHLYADFNSQVKKGQVIARIDPAILKAKLAEAQANWKSAEAARVKAEVAVADAKRQRKRVEDLFKQNLTSESDLDAVRFILEGAEAELKVKAAAADQAKAAVEREKLNLAYTTIYAPIDGVVISRDVDVGQTVAASLQAPTLFTIARDLVRMQIETDVDEAFIGMIKEEQLVNFTVFAFPERKFKGRVAQVRLKPKVDAGVVKYNCIIYVDNSDLSLLPGMTATVSIETMSHENVLTVPNAATRFVPNWPADELRKLRQGLQSHDAILWIKKETGLQPLKVSIGIVGEKRTEVNADGLTEGMQVAIPAKREETRRRRAFGISLF